MENLEQLTLNQIVGVLKELTGRLEEIKEAPKDEKLVLLPNEAMKLLGVGRNTMYEDLLKRDDFPKFRINSKFFIPKKELEIWVSSQCKKS